MNCIEIAEQRVSDLSVAQICESIEKLNGRCDEQVTLVRGWLIDELERRDPENFWAWIECEDPMLMDTPSFFFVTLLD